MDKNSRNAGFTLLEVLAVLAIATLVIAIALPRIGVNASPAATEAIAMRIMAALDQDRYAARRRGITLVSELDIRNNRIRLATRNIPLALPASIELGARAVKPCDPTGLRVIFHADGSTCAPQILVTSATAVRSITVNPLTGAMSLGQ